MIVERPIVRQFLHAFAARAARHVRQGGHAVVWEPGERARLVFQVPDDDDVMDLGYWSLLDLGKHRYERATSGPYKGLATALVPRDCHDIVRRRAERDSVWPGATKRSRFDCLRCGACCRDNRVELDRADIARFRAAGAEHLSRRPYARKEAGGKIVLSLLRSKACRHLGRDNKCGIYTLRPAACSQFPVGSECCLISREEELGVVDGLPS